MASRAASKSKTLLDIFQPQPVASSAKRLKPSSLGFSESKHPNPIRCQGLSSLSKCDNNDDDVVLPIPNDSESSQASSAPLTDQQISRMEFHKMLAKAKRNQKTCSERVSKSKGENFTLIFFFLIFRGFLIQCRVWKFCIKIYKMWFGS